MRNKRSADVLARLKLITDTRSDAALSEALGVSPQTLSSWKARDSIPYSICVELAGQRGISLDWLLVGQGPMWRREREAMPPTPQGSPREDEMLELFRSLEESDQLFLQHQAREKQRVRELERRIAALASLLEQHATAL